MINLSEFIIRLAAWRKEKGTVPANTFDPSAEAAFLKLEERKVLLHATVLEKKIDQLRGIIRGAEQSLKTLQDDLLRLKNQVEIKVPVATGEMLSFDLGKEKLFQDFWQKPEAKRLNHDVPKTSASRYYDSALLAQESDDLLFYV